MIQEAIDAKLPTRATEWQDGVGHRDMCDYRIKLSNSKANAVYWAYFDFHIAHPAVDAASDAEIRQFAHHSAKIAIAYLECHCHHCRFISRGFCPEAAFRILNAYHTNYQAEFFVEYGNEFAFFVRSPCLIMQAMRERRDVMTTLY
jgi:hypothetical protein